MPTDENTLHYLYSELLGFDICTPTMYNDGNPLSLPGEDGVYRVYSPEGAFLALSRLDQGRLTTIKSFFEV